MYTTFIHTCMHVYIPTKALTETQANMHRGTFKYMVIVSGVRLSIYLDILGTNGGLVG